MAVKVLNFRNIDILMFNYTWFTLEHYKIFKANVHIIEGSTEYFL